MEPQKGRRQELDFGNLDSRAGSGVLLVTQHGHSHPYDPQAWFSHMKAKGRNLMIQDPKQLLHSVTQGSHWEMPLDSVMANEARDKLQG